MTRRGNITPDAFPQDAYGWLANQAGHIVLGLFAAVLAMVAGLWWPIPLAVAAVYWVVSEYVLQRAGEFLDGLTDTGFVAAGASVPAALAWHPLAALGLCVATGAVMAVGALRRAKR